MKKRNPVVVGILTLCTLGLYGLYWLSSLRVYLRERGFKTVKKSEWVGLLFLLIPVAIVADIYLQKFYPKQASKISTDFMIAILSLIVLYPLSYMMWASSFHRILSEATNGKLANKLVALPYGLGFLGFMQLQAKMNQWLTTTVLVTDQPGPPPPYVPPPEPPKPSLLDQIHVQPSAPLVYPNQSIGPKDDTPKHIAPQPVMPVTTPRSSDIIEPEDQVPVTGGVWQEGISTVHKTIGIMPENAPKLPEEPKPPVNEKITTILTPSEASLVKEKEEPVPPPPPPAPIKELPKPVESVQKEEVKTAPIAPPPPPPLPPAPAKPAEQLPPPEEETPSEGGEIHIPHDNN